MKDLSLAQLDLGLPDKATIYIVGLPIGNPFDISLRALSWLPEFDCIAAEDTRNFKILAKKLGIQYKKLISYHEHNETDVSAKIITEAKNGANIAIVSDAGTPGICDPGFKIIHLAVKNNIPIKSLPGPSSLSTALSLSPIGGNHFYFLGFCPNKRQQRYEFFKQLDINVKTVMFESPHRILDHLKQVVELWPNRKLAILRELSKTYEEIRFHTVDEHLEQLQNSDLKGELVLIYEPYSSPDKSLDSVEEEILILLKKNLPTTDITKEIMASFQLKRKEAYQLVESVKQQLGNKHHGGKT